MTCPHCGFQFTGLATNTKVDKLPDVVPGVCAECASLFLVVRGKTRTMLPGEIDVLRHSPLWPWLEEMMTKISHAVRERQREQLDQCAGSKRPILN